MQPCSRPASIDPLQACGGAGREARWARMNTSSSDKPGLARRDFLQTAVSGLAALAATSGTAVAAAQGKAVKNGRIRQSIVPWCWETCPEKWSLDKICQVAVELGVPSVELTDISSFPTLKKHGLTSAIAQINMNPDPPFLRGFNNPAHWDRAEKAVREAIDGAAAFGCPSVICFTGYSAKDPAQPDGAKFTPEEGAANCVEGFKRVLGYAEQKKVTLVMEMLNSRVTDHPMKGHPGYQGDHMDYCVDILKRIGSPRLKMLFDVYHVQIMDGDVITRIRKHKDYIGHVHVAGVPGRGELDEKQEINFPGVMRALLEVGYTGYVGQEFIPTRDPYQGLREAVALCDV